MRYSTEGDDEWGYDLPFYEELKFVVYKDDGGSYQIDVDKAQVDFELESMDVCLVRAVQRVEYDRSTFELNFWSKQPDG